MSELPPEIEDPIIQAGRIIGEVINERISELTKVIKEKEISTVINNSTAAPAQPVTDATITAKTVAIEVNKFSIALNDTLNNDQLNAMEKAQALRSIVRTADAVVSNYLQQYEAAVIEETNEQNARDKK